ncbi:MAG TPA: 50S ribosomal protein L9, partial [Ruminococcus sp.]|nr:50S ribosomal protein L9 [Ruminococcus sp.]
FGVKVDKKKISLKTDIKNFGIFDVSIKLYAGINSDISVEVVEG